jgi:predicted Fe-Mo cluster-binding NifX family protein
MIAAIRVAVASREGIAISEHFGHAKQFYIYDISDTAVSFAETRKVSHYCLGGHSDSNALPAILDTIADCKAVFVAKIGDAPAEKLNARGIVAVSDYSWQEIVPSLLDYAAKGMAAELP